MRGWLSRMLHRLACAVEHDWLMDPYRPRLTCRWCPKDKKIPLEEWNY